LFLLLFKPLFLILLVVNKLLVLDVHAFLVIPFEHLVGAFLHPKSFLFLLKDECLEEISFGLDDELRSKLHLVVLLSYPFFVRHFQCLLLERQYLRCVGNLAIAAIAEK